MLAREEPMVERSSGPHVGRWLAASALVTLCVAAAPYAGGGSAGAESAAPAVGGTATHVQPGAATGSDGAQLYALRRGPDSRRKDANRRGGGGPAGDMGGDPGADVAQLWQ